MSVQKKYKTPLSIGIIIDGNRRWAKDNGLTVAKGHRAGFDNLKACISWAEKAGVKNLIFYVFSTENWKRSKEEVTNLTKFLKSGLHEILDEAKKKKTSVRFIGQRERWPKPVQALMSKVEEETKTFKEKTVAFALSYGGRAEIVHAVNSILKKGQKKEVTEKEFEKELWTNGLPDPDIIIRTGNTMRLSNFLPWQSVYSELYFTGTLWPDFDEEEFNHVLDEYKERERRIGK
ncbi:di-trans,poly-cis-decaprenylcistransferase [Patescibacteria group bacterium]|nr:di-trans,poly-cis-decaprenylcistransferase [Patescibacteria group bacterium]